MKCSSEFNIFSHVIACHCGGLVDFEYDLESIGWRWHTNLGDGTLGLLRYSKLLPITNPSKSISVPGRFNKPTPLYKSERLGKFLGLKNLWIKDETKNFTSTFKAREAFVAISRFQDIGVQSFVLSSTGNTSAAFSYAMRFAKMPIFANFILPKSTVIDFPSTVHRIAKFQFVDLPYDKCIEFAKKYSIEIGVPFEGGFANPARREGVKTLVFEIAETGLSPDWYVQAITSGTGAYGFYKGYSELVRLGVAKTIPRILCVQPENCSPIVDTFREGSEYFLPKFAVPNPSTFVTTLSNGNPYFSYPYVRQVVLKSNGGMEKVTESEIGQAMVNLLKLENIVVEPAPAVALAGLIKYVQAGKIDKDATIVLNISGGLSNQKHRSLGSRMKVRERSIQNAKKEQGNSQVGHAFA